jgi:hypothetical protein
MLFKAVALGLLLKKAVRLALKVLLTMAAEPDSTWIQALPRLE